MTFLGENFDAFLKLKDIDIFVTQFYHDFLILSNEYTKFLK